MTKIIKFILIFTGFVSFSFSALGEQTQIHSYKMSIKPHDWRLIYAANNPVEYQAFALKNPNRIVVDIKNASVRRQFKASQLVDTPIERIRYANRKNNMLRLVFDINYPLKVKAYTLPADDAKPYRLVVELLGNKEPVLAFNWPVKSAFQLVNFHKSKKQQVITVSKKFTRSRKVIIVIDPGHGGKDPGAIGLGGTDEKNVVLAVSRDLQRLINQQPGFAAYLTRDGDYYLTLRQRLAVARKYKPDMFIAIHADIWKNRAANGASVFALSQRGATSEAARWLASRENKSELMGGVKLSDKTSLLRSVLINLSQTATIRASLFIGYDIIHSLSQVTHLHHSRVEQAAFVVLKSPDIPSLLVETGFLSNRHEERRLNTVVYREQLARSIEKGIVEYFSKQPPRGTWLALKKYHPKLTKPRTITISHAFTARKPAIIKYTVKKGDTLTAISKKFNMSPEKLKQMNKLNSNQLLVGQRLQLPR